MAAARRADRERAHEDQELADEAGQAGQPDAGEHEEAEEGSVGRRPARQAAHARDRPIVRPLVDDAHAQEEGAGDEAVVDHLQDGPVHGLLLEDEDAQRHEAHVADGAVGDQLLEVGLDDGDDGAVDDGDEREHDDERRERLRGIGEERQRETQEAVAAELEQDAGQDDRTGRRRLDVRIGQPGVERPHRAP